jgi:NAD(P)-dependent dehydrogenase (short-subunit alcohol dehydrogenase family)
METAGEDITCNAVAPATLPTPAIEGKIRGIADDQGISVDAATRNYLAERQPGGRFVSMQAVAPSWGFCADRIPATSAAAPSRWIADGPLADGDSGAYILRI